MLILDSSYMSLFSFLVYNLVINFTKSASSPEGDSSWLFILKRSLCGSGLSTGPFTPQNRSRADANNLHFDPTVDEQHLNMYHSIDPLHNL